MGTWCPAPSTHLLIEWVRSDSWCRPWCSFHHTAKDSLWWSVFVGLQNIATHWIPVTHNCSALGLLPQGQSNRTRWLLPLEQTGVVLVVVRQQSGQFGVVQDQHITLFFCWTYVLYYSKLLCCLFTAAASLVPASPAPSLWLYEAATDSYRCGEAVPHRRRKKNCSTGRIPTDPPLCVSNLNSPHLI